MDSPQFLFSTSASDYSHGRNQVLLNDQQHYESLAERMSIC
ncbi:hypothetical protein RchiOBHm_Chr5g0079531 [Rosa chinensis]|uniref:Uncharacterized protein n=1 Tax=Rosa chinensis TaxID=74649 RepID=A0A2P6QMH2_ROSCH|nr:hypothetical protein RchiOBHm_Chr5g0079531 [Rosa chinensis]